MPSDPHTPAPLAGAPSRVATERLRVGLLKLNAWVVIFLVPALHLESAGGAWRWTLALTALVALAAGLRWLGAAPVPARMSLLAVFPPLLGLTASNPELVEREVLDPATALLGAISLLVFVGATAGACSRIEPLKPSTVRGGRAREPVIEPPRRRWLRRMLLGLVGLGALFIAGVVPIWPDRTAGTERWGDAGGDAAVLTVVVASVTAALAVGAIVGPALRAERRPSRRRGSRLRRLLVAVLAACLAAAAYFALTQLDPLA